MRKLIALTAPLAAAVAFAAGVVAGSASAQARNSVPESAFASYRAMSAPYKDVAVAEADQYGAIHNNQGIYCIADPAGMGAMGIHYVNVGYLLDGMIDASQPEALVYAPARGGSLHLVALEYIVFKDAWDAAHTSRPELFAGHPFDETDSPNRFDLPPFYSQHVWLWRGNPNGNLDMWNPAVHCPS